MKISELKKQIENYTPEQLQKLVVEMYKALPKAAREDNSIETLVVSPDSPQSAKPAGKNALRSIGEIENETLQFIDYARSQYYLASNRYVPKSERPKWRFLARRLYKEICAASNEKRHALKAATLLEGLYTLLCDACDKVLFTAYYPFESVGIAQAEFFRQVLTLHESVVSKRELIEKALALIDDNGVNRYTLYSDLMSVILGFLRTPDLRSIAIEQANEMRRARQESQTTSTDFFVKHRRTRKGNNLVEFVFRCFLALSQTDDALDYFAMNYVEDNPEVKLYILVRLLFEYGDKENIERVISDAEVKGIKPRADLQKLRDYISKNQALPKFIGSL